MQQAGIQHENIQCYQYNAETCRECEERQERDGGAYWHIYASAGKAADMTGWLEMHGMHA